MEQSQLDMLEQKGFDVNGCLKRFLNNAGLYEKCLKKFLEDDSYHSLVEAYEAGNCQEAFKAAHTLKGLTSNLGIDPLYHILQPMVEKLRADDLNVAQEIEQLKIAYQDAYQAVEEL